MSFDRTWIEQLRVETQNSGLKVLNLLTLNMRLGWGRLEYL